ncbi:MAG: 4Fe-4S ferredoxin, partial [Eggerthellaceae bacterium]
LCIACDPKYCEDCPRAAGRGELLFTRAVEMAEAWSGGAVRFDREMPELEESTHTVARDQFGRREAFDSVKDNAIDIISGKRRLKNSDTLKDVYRKKERKRMQDMLNLTEGDVINEFAESGRTRQTMPPRRRMLLEALCAKPEMASNVGLVVSATNRATCVECLDCTKSCPTGARTIGAENGSLPTTRAIA